VGFQRLVAMHYVFLDVHGAEFGTSAPLLTQTKSSKNLQFLIVICCKVNRSWPSFVSLLSFSSLLCYYLKADSTARSFRWNSSPRKIWSLVSLFVSFEAMKEHAMKNLDLQNIITNKTLWSTLPLRLGVIGKL
jgi:hypothetical protein